MKKKFEVCSECQFEKGHSRGCSKFVEPKNPQKDQQEKWEEEFDEITLNLPDNDYDNFKVNIKQFIKDLLAQNTEQVIKEIEDAIDDLPRICGKEDNHEYIDTCKIYKILTKLRDRK